jgi:hypothetical protein
VQGSKTQTASPPPRVDPASHAATRISSRCAQCPYRSIVISVGSQTGSANAAAVGGGDCGDAAGSENHHDFLAGGIQPTGLLASLVLLFWSHGICYRRV